MLHNDNASSHNNIIFFLSQNTLVTIKVTDDLLALVVPLLVSMTFQTCSYFSRHATCNHQIGKLTLD